MREAQETAGSTAPLVVTGVLAAELARALRGGADDGAAVRVGGDSGGAAAMIVVLGGRPTADDERVLREAARASVPIVVVQTDPRADVALAYAPAQAVVVCRAGQGFPVEEIAVALASRLGRDAVPLAARVPVLRACVVRELIRRASLRAAVVGALPWRKGADFRL